jgi:hypothetical protein
MGISRRSKWLNRSVRRENIFAIPLAFTHPILLLSDADLPQVAQKGGIYTPELNSSYPV